MEPLFGGLISLAGHGVDPLVHNSAAMLFSMQLSGLLDVSDYFALLCSKSWTDTSRYTLPTLVVHTRRSTRPSLGVEKGRRRRAAAGHPRATRTAGGTK